MTAKSAGTSFETDTLKYLRGKSLSAERLAKAGSLDEGDIWADLYGVEFVFELKCRRDKNSSLSLGAWLKEAEVEAQNYAKARGGISPAHALIVKRVGKSVEEAFVVMPLKDFVMVAG